MRTNWIAFVSALLGTVAFISTPALTQDSQTDDDPLGFLEDDTPPAAPATAPSDAPAAAPPAAEVESDDAVAVDEPLELEGSAEEASSGDASPPPMPSGGPKLDEIIVTAQKRAENVQDVPLSVTAIGGEALKENNIGDLGAISEFTPNLVILSTPTFNYVTMRGVGTGFNRGLEQSVAIVIDEVYYGRASYLSNGLLDLEAIEVLRGPQGTLFGKNSAAGAVHLRTANPTQDFEIEADATYGTYNYWRARGAASGPVPGTSDELMFRVAFQVERRDGFIENTTLDRDEQNLDQTTVRGKLLWEPTPSFSIQLQGTYGITQQAGTGIQIHQGTPRSIAAMQVFDPQFNDTLDDETSLDFPSFVDRKYYEATGIVTYEFNNGLELKSITNYAGFNEEVKFDADFSPIPFITLQNDEEYKQFSQEIRLTSPPGEFEYVAGLYYFSNEVDALYRVEALANIVELILITGALSPDQQTAQYSALGVAQGVAGANLLRGRLNANGGTLSAQESATNPFVQESDSYAAFFQANWHMSDVWTLIVGNRVSYEVKKLVEGGQILENHALPLLPSIIFPAIQSGSVNFTDQRERDEFNVSPKVVLQYNGFYAGQVYASAASGYKGGGYNAQPVAPNQVEFDEETSITFELGTKLDLFDGAGRFNIAAFYTFYNDFQSSAFNGTAFIPTNVGDTRVTGIEFDGAQALTDWLMLTYSGSFMHSEYKEFKNGPCQAFETAATCDLSSKSFAQPKFTITTGLAMDKPLGNWPLRLIANITGSYATVDFLTTDRDTADQRDSYFLARGAIGIRDIDDVWALTVYGSNLTDLNQFSDADDQPTFTGAHFANRIEPREIKVEGRVRF